MNKDVYDKQLLNFYSYNFYLEKIPLEIYQDEKLDVKCAVMKIEDSDNVTLVTLGRPFFREEEPPVEATVSCARKYLKDKEEAKLMKEFLRDLMEKEYEDVFDGNMAYPGVFEIKNEEFIKHFGKVAYTLAIRNGGDPVFIELEDEDRVAFVIAPVFLGKEQYEEYKELNEEDDLEAFDYLASLDDDEDCWLIK